MISGSSIVASDSGGRDAIFYTPSRPEALAGAGLGLAPGQPSLDLADDALAEGQHADDEDDALDHRDPRAELGQVGLHHDDDEGADDRAQHGAGAADQNHQDHLARHDPMHV